MEPAHFALGRSLASGHNPAVDGLRGLAILMVIGFHYGRLAFGWAGVQIFFVLSGFLITSVLLADADLSLGLYLKRFYWRRLLRIFPLYYLYLGFVAAAYFFTGKPSLFGRYWPSLLTYTFNLEFLSPSYRNEYTFGHFWSLAIEEQFYLFWPLALYFLDHRRRQTAALAMVLTGPMVRAAAAAVLTLVNPNSEYVGGAIYEFSLSHIDAFAIGAFLAMRKPGAEKSAFRLLFFATIALIGCGVAANWFNRGTFAVGTSLGYVNHMMHGQEVWGYTLINLWGASLLNVMRIENGFSWLFAWRPLAFIGQISYGMYVYHCVIQEWLMPLLGRHAGIAEFGKFVVYLSVVVAVSAASYFSFEKRLLGLKGRYFRRPTMRTNRAFVASART